jgi:hypothetical protein
MLLYAAGSVLNTRTNLLPTASEDHDSMATDHSNSNIKRQLQLD